MPPAVRRLHRAYRATGADLPFGDPLPAHGVAMEGYFWRFTDPASGRVVIALNGVNRDPAGDHWATVGLAAHPGGFLRTVAADQGWADPGRLGARAAIGSVAPGSADVAPGSALDGTGTDTTRWAFRADAGRVLVDLGPDARLHVEVLDPVPWPRRRHGGSSVFQVVPALNQYWHPWLLGGTARGAVTLGDQTWRLDGASVYAEKNWGRGGFPEAWWWGQAQGFAEPTACVAFAGGLVHSGPLRTTVTALVVLLPDGTLVRLGNPGSSPVRAKVTDEDWVLRGRSATWQVEVEGHGPLAGAHVLPVPLPAERRNIPGAIEHLAASLRVRVRRRGRTVWAGESALAALEHGGIDRARAEVARRGHPEGATGAPPSA